jgi:hypothetical protein
MLTIVDLHQEEELSSSRMSKVGGGMTCDQAIVASQVYTVIGDFFARGGDSTSAGIYYGKADGVVQGGC